MKTKIFYLGFLLISSFCFGQKVYQRTEKLMGSRFDFTVVAENDVLGNQYIGLAISEISRIEKLISSWDTHSQTSLINKNAGIVPVVINDELIQLIYRSLK